MAYTSLTDSRADALMDKRGIFGHVTADKFRRDFKAYLSYYDCTTDGDCNKTLDILENDDILTNTDIFSTNFRKSIWDLVSEDLKSDIIFRLLFVDLLGVNGKGIGKGELVFPLIFSDYLFSNEGDGYFCNKTKRLELKVDGASLKPIKTGVTDKGLVDKLNAKYFDGNPPGYKSGKLFEKHIQSVKDPKDYELYFKELYPGCDVSTLVSDAIKHYNNADKFNTAVGRFALKQYKKVDGWYNIVYIKESTLEVVNISDVNDIENLNLKFSPKLKRAKDSQAIADGYVNVKV